MHIPEGNSVYIVLNSIMTSLLKNITNGICVTFPSNMSKTGWLDLRPDFESGLAVYAPACGAPPRLATNPKVLRPVADGVPAIWAR